MKKINALLVLLMSSLAITGISFLDGKIWDVLFRLIGMAAYAIVGVLFSIGILRGKKEGKDAYGLVFLLLALGGFGFYQVLVSFIHWVSSLPLDVAIAASIVLLITIRGLVALVLWLCRRNSESRLMKKPEEAKE